jgi:hypothetical protein
MQYILALNNENKRFPNILIKYRSKRDQSPKSADRDKTPVNPSNEKFISEEEDILCIQAESVKLCKFDWCIPILQ